MRDYIIVNGELYHYGVKGMKWGVRKTKAQRQADYVKNYKRKEITSLNKESDKNAKVGQRRIDRAARNFDKKLDKYGQPSDPNTKNPATKAATKYIKTKARVATEERVLREEAKKVASMNYADVKAEKAKVGRDYLLSAIGTGASIAVMLSTPMPVAVAVTPNTRNVKRKNRISNDRIQAIYEEEFANAANDVYKPRS